MDASSGRASREPWEGSPEGTGASRGAQRRSPARGGGTDRSARSSSARTGGSAAADPPRSAGRREVEDRTPRDSARGAVPRGTASGKAAGRSAAGTSASGSAARSSAARTSATSAAASGSAARSRTDRSSSAARIPKDSAPRARTTAAADPGSRPSDRPRRSADGRVRTPVTAPDRAPDRAPVRASVRTPARPQSPAARRSPAATPPTRTRPPGNRPPGPPPPRPPSRGVRRTRIALAVASALVLVVTGTAWSLYRDLTAGLTTTNVITGGSSGGDQNILLVGVDSRTDAQGNPLPQSVLAALHGGADSGVLNSDTIIVLHLPADGGGATAFSIPRDSYVDIPGYRKDKINAAYPVTKALKAEELVKQGVSQRDADQQSSATGRSTLIETVQNLTGLQIDHYAEINLLGFYNLTQAIGGVDVCLKAAVKDEFSGADFPAGPQTISGAEALEFVRQRHGLPGGDLSRIRRQQVFLAAVADKVLSSGTLTNGSTLSALMDVAQKSLVIDSGWDLLGFARQASDLAAGKLDFLTIPTQGGANNERGDVVLVDPFQVEQFVEQRTAPPEDAATTTAPAAPTVDPKTVTVDVGNGSGGTGLAAQVADRLGGAGYLRGAVENSTSRSTSVVRYAQADGDAAARAVAAQLGGIGVQQADGVAAGHVQVLLGSDYQGAAAPAAASAGASSNAPAAQPEVNAGGVPCID